MTHFPNSKLHFVLVASTSRHPITKFDDALVFLSLRHAVARQFSCSSQRQSGNRAYNFFFYLHQHALEMCPCRLRLDPMEHKVPPYASA